ncbi:MAG: Uma2 family endonuclease [Phycisphaerae bacterium]|nr:Uma2 family endonuclease [Phycisphaerae bacterium]
MFELMPNRFRFTRDMYYRMAEAGILRETDRVELIRGEILQMSPIGPSHSSVVQALILFFGRRLPDGIEFRVQDPIVLGDESEPEPDIAVVRARPDGYRTSHPMPADVLLIVEVAGSSFDFDMNTKAELYASAGLSEYWVLDVARLRAHVHREPREGRYQQITVHQPPDRLSILNVPGVVLPLDAVLR